MELNDAIYTYLSGYSGLAALVDKRIYPDVLPQKPTYPALTYQQISEEEVDSFQTPTTNLIGPTYQFDCWGSTRSSANAVSKQVRLAFKNYSGVMGGVGGVTVSGIEKIGRSTDHYTNSDGIILAYRTLIEFQIWHQEVT